MVISLLPSGIEYANWIAVAPGANGPFTVTRLPAATAFVGGVMFAFVGIVLAAIRRHEPQPEASIPAHVAFTSRTVQELEPIPRVAREPAVSKRPASDDPHALAIVGIDAQVRELTKRINKASVMLATGKLSGDAYKKYVDELKLQRGALEADRVHLELRKRTA